MCVCSRFIQAYSDLICARHPTQFTIACVGFLIYISASSLEFVTACDALTHDHSVRSLKCKIFLSGSVCVSRTNGTVVSDDSEFIYASICKKNELSTDLSFSIFVRINLCAFY